MSCEYSCEKKKLKIEKIIESQMFFRNGDFIELSKNEIVFIDVDFYDNLIFSEGGYCPVVKQGIIKLKINNKKPKYDKSLVYDSNKYSSNRKEYIENRCINEGAPCYFKVFDKNYWQDTFYGSVEACMQGEELVLLFKENKTYGSFDSKQHCLKARNIMKQDVWKLHLDFENADGIDVYQEEIKKFELNFRKALAWNSTCYERTVESGIIELKFDKRFTRRDAQVFCGMKKNTIKNYEKRICGKGYGEIDICNLYVTYNHAGYGMYPEEGIGVEDIRYREDANSQDKDFDKENGFACYVSGYAKKKLDGNIVIVFGKPIDKKI